MNHAMERPAAYLRMMETVPTGAYLAAALGSVAASATLRLFGKKDAAIFVGQWPPTFLLFSLAYKLLRPSQDDPAAEMHAAADEAARLAGSRR